MPANGFAKVKDEKPQDAPETMGLEEAIVAVGSSLLTQKRYQVEAIERAVEGRIQFDAKDKGLSLQVVGFYEEMQSLDDRAYSALSRLDPFSMGRVPAFNRLSGRQPVLQIPAGQ
jgi:hypothetical protein